MADKKIKAAIIGASGYTGAELVRLLYNHPSVEITALVAEKNAGKTIGEVYPHLGVYPLPDIVTMEEVNWKNVDAVFCCLPHGASHEAVRKLPAHLKIIDLSADFRFKDVVVYQEWYGIPHPAADVQKEVVYALPEIFRNDIKNARIVACPGCYPTSAILPLYPLLASKTILPDDIIVDSKSGVTGAGRTAKQASLFSEIHGGMKAYGVSGHRHTPEIEQGLSHAAGTSVYAQFTPQLAPMNRGILSIIYAKLADGKQVADVRQVLEAKYQSERFVKVMPEEHAPSTRETYGTNECRIGIFQGRAKNRIVLVSVIDNLVKGASGQAVQNMNIMFGLPEATGLDLIPLFP